MDQSEIKALEAIAKLKPHVLTERGMARMVVRWEIDPLTGRDTGRRYVDPIFIAGMERQGYDPEPVIRRLLEVDARED